MSILPRSLLALTLLVLSACSDPEDSSQYQDLNSEVTDLEAELNDLQVELTELVLAGNVIKSDGQRVLNATKKSKENLEKEVQKAKAERDLIVQEINLRLLDSATRKKVIEELAIPACINYSLFYLSNISQIDDRGEEAWSQAFESLPENDKYWQELFFTDTTAAGGVPEGFKTLTSELQAYKSSCQEAGQEAYFKRCTSFDRLLLKKDPEAFRGQCLKGKVRISQMDSNTGPCSFQGYVGGGFDVRSQFGVSLNPYTHFDQTECEWTDLLREDMTINFWGIAIGAFTYDTSLGGRQTIPSFRLIQWQRT